jgi:thymidine kinase
VAGNITVITGPMKCGKSEEISRRIRRYKIAERNVTVFKPDTDNRFAEDQVVSRDGSRIDCTVIPASNPEYILSFIDNSTDVIVIDEAQFFEPQQYFVDDPKFCLRRAEKYTITDIVQELCDRGHEVIVAGLDMTDDRKPFREMPNLLAIAHDIVKLKAVCEYCKKEQAIYSIALFNKSNDVEVGDEGKYKVACQICYLRHKKKNN